ncbi:RNA recognition motif (RRM, RBD, or RNP domain) [Novymonas esmeraldas]|uniref:Peptidyl-prolyl cis-trans isomerase n=1 Tax=Novymonas esmeraldas TaxID=1808958 RepID=A0AAW0ELR7_9TRYP
MSSTSAGVAGSGAGDVGVVTAGLLLQTSAGAVAIDLFGADCPALTGNFVNLCRAQLWDGAVATEVIPEVAVFFSPLADHVYGERLLALLRAHTTAAAAPAGPDSLNFYSLLPRQGCDTASPADPVQEQETALRRAMQLEARLCRRRRCVGLEQSATTATAVTAGAARRRGGVGGGDGPCFQPVYAPVSGGGAPASASSRSPCTVHRAGSLLVDTSSATPRFGLTLTDRSLDYLDHQYVTIGVVREGEAVLHRIRRAPLHDRGGGGSGEDASPSTAEGCCVAGRPAQSWPRPVRLLRVKQATVLPTAGTDAYLRVPASAWWGVSAAAGSAASAEAQQRRQRTGAALHQAGCFRWWAPVAAVRAARRQLVELAQASLLEHSYAAVTRPSTAAEASLYLSPATAATQPPIIVAVSAASTLATAAGGDGGGADAAAEVGLAANPHYTGDYLSSEDEAGDGDGVGVGRDGAALSARQLEERRRSFMQRHQEKANETLSLMLHVLNGVADVSGDIKPPDNVLFVCKLNPVTTGEGLALCFTQFGRVTSAEVVQDAATRQSLCYGFVEFESVEACFRAFQKMDRALVDDCRIHVDFSQSVSKLWARRQREMMRKRGRV